MVGHPLKGPLSREKLPHGKKIVVSLLRNSRIDIPGPIDRLFAFTGISRVASLCLFTAPDTHQDRDMPRMG